MIWAVLGVILTALTVGFIVVPFFRQGESSPVNKPPGELDQQVELKIRERRGAGEQFCPQCGAKRHPGDQFCANCGNRLD